MSVATGRMMGGNFFQPDDYDDIYEIFLPLRRSGAIMADPSGWLDTVAEASELLPEVCISGRDLAHYCIDEGSALGETKERIVGLISKWEDRPLREDEVTLCHSVSTSTLAVLLLLKGLGTRAILFETPAYGVTINQAISLGFDVALIPTFMEENFRTSLKNVNLGKCSPCALWLTQPRMSLGYDQAPDDLHATYELLSSRDYMVIDEATEQRFPSVLRDISKGKNIIRMRGLLKGTGLNGLRLAFVLHDSSLRSHMESAQAVVGESLELFSLRAAVAVAEQPNRLRDMLAVANRQTTELRATAEKIAYGSNVAVSKLVNGYIGSAFVDLRALRGDYQEKRSRLLKFCLARKLPVILGASMKFAFDPAWEQVRLNYFNHSRHITRGIMALADFSAGS